MFIQGYKNTMHNFFAINISIVYLILNIIDCIPKFDWIQYTNTQIDIPFFCKLIGSMRIIFKDFDYVLCLSLFIYTFYILKHVPSQKNSIENIFKIIIGICWGIVILCIILLLLLLFKDFKVSLLGECYLDNKGDMYHQLSLIVVGIIEVFCIIMIYRSLKIEEKNESIEYNNLNKVFYLGIALVCVLVISIVVNVIFNFTGIYDKYFLQNKLIVRGIHYIYYVSFLAVYFINWSYIKECLPSDDKRNNVEMNKYFLEA